MSGWLRHRPGNAGPRSKHPGITGAMGPPMSWDPWPTRSCEWPWGRRSVHRSVKMASRSCFGAFVYTVATREALRGDAGGRKSVHKSVKMASRVRFGAFVHTVAPRAASSGTSASITMVCRRRPLGGHLSLSRETRLCASGAVARLASSSGRQPTQTPEEPESNLAPPNRTVRLAGEMSRA